MLSGVCRKLAVGAAGKARSRADAHCQRVHLCVVGSAHRVPLRRIISGRFVQVRLYHVHKALPAQIQRAVRAVLAVEVLMLFQPVNAPAVLFQQIRCEFRRVLFHRSELLSAGFRPADLHTDAIAVALAAAAVPGVPGVAVFRNALHDLRVIHRVVERDLPVVAAHISDLIGC